MIPACVTLPQTVIQALLGRVALACCSGVFDYPVEKELCYENGPYCRVSVG
jgi:hypothetical protein